MGHKRWLIGLLVLLWIVGLGSLEASAAKPPIRIGFMSSLTGALAGPGSELRDGFLLYLDEIGNKVADREIQVLVEDDEGNPSVGLNKFRKLVEKEKVPLLAGIFTSGVAYAVRDYVHEQKIPLVICNAGAFDLTTRKASPYLFRASFSNTTTNKYFVDYVYDKLGYRKAIIMAQDYPAGWEWVGSFAYYFIRRGGKVVQEFYTKIGTADYAPYITAMDEKKADCLYTMMSGADAIRFNIQYEELGKKDKIPHLTPMNQVDGVVIREAGDASAGIIFSEPFGDMKGPEWDHFWNLYSKKYKTDLISNFAAHGYVGAMFIVKALQDIKGNIEDKEAFMKALRRAKINSPIGPKSFDQYQNALHDVIIMQLKKVGNKFEYVLIQKIPQAGQFGGMSPEEWMKSVPDWGAMRGKWVEYKPGQ